MRRGPRWAGHKSLTIAQQIAAVAGAIAGALVAVKALVDGDDGARPVPKATLTVERFEPNVTLGQFAERFPDFAPQRLTATQRAAAGGAMHLDLEFRNFNGRHCTLTWTMFDHATDSPLPGRRFTDRQAGTFDLNEAFEHFTPPVWIPAPTRVEDVYVVFALAAGNTPCGSPFRSKNLAVE